MDYAFGNDFYGRMVMKFISVSVLLSIVLLSGCGTVGGTISGVGEDLRRAGDWIRSK